MVPVKIKADKFGQAIALLLQRGGAFQTRFEHTLIVNAEQRRVLQEAGLVAANGKGQKKTRKGVGAKATLPISPGPMGHREGKSRSESEGTELSHSARCRG